MAASHLGRPRNPATSRAPPPLTRRPLPASMEVMVSTGQDRRPCRFQRKDHRMRSTRTRTTPKRPGWRRRRRKGSAAASLPRSRRVSNRLKGRKRSHSVFESCPSICPCLLFSTQKTLPRCFYIPPCRLERWSEGACISFGPAPARCYISSSLGLFGERA